MGRGALWRSAPGGRHKFLKSLWATVISAHSFECLRAGAGRSPVLGHAAIVGRSRPGLKQPTVTGLLQSQRPLGPGPGSEPQGDLDRLEQGAGLVDRLLILRGGVG